LPTKEPPVGGTFQFQIFPAKPLPSPSAAFDVVLCQQGLQFFPDRIGALREMRRVLQPGGRVGIAVWVEIERNPLYAAYHAALRSTVPAQLADAITAPFSWPSGLVLKSAAEGAGFRDIHLLTRSLPMVLEAGVEQAVQTFAGTPVAPSVAELQQDVQDALFVRMRQELTKLLKGERVVADWTSNLIVGRA
jgi:SAM-dependent methyltransferase